jgi:hypothetical protein
MAVRFGRVGMGEALAELRGLDPSGSERTPSKDFPGANAASSQIRLTAQNVPAPEYLRRLI